MTIYTIIRGADGMGAEVDTNEEMPSAAIFDLYSNDGETTIYWSDIADIEGAAVALVERDLDRAEHHLAGLDLLLDRPKKRVFTVIENMRRITRYEVEEDDLTPAEIELLDRVGDTGDDVDEERLVDSLIEAAGGEDGGEVLDIDLADDPQYFVTDTTVEGS